MRKYLIVIAVIVGLLIAYVDSRPNWDDSAISAGAVFIMSALFGAIEPRKPWLWALAVGVWIPLYEIVKTGNYGSLAALGFALIGAYLGMAVRKVVSPAQRQR